MRRALGIAVLAALVITPLAHGTQRTRRYSRTGALVATLLHDLVLAHISSTPAHAAARVGAAVGFAAAPSPTLPPAPAPTPFPTVTPSASATPWPTATPTASPTATATATLPPANPRSVSVAGTEYAFTLTQKAVDSGSVHVQFDLTRAADPHELVIESDTGVVYDSGKQSPGSATQATVKLDPGTYYLLCPLPTHEGLGMHAQLTVR